jgi:malonate-semialdehyde dehydrogenase (acetylating)/methylmalonate-semialdehyde dehydrogenase
MKILELMNKEYTSRRIGINVPIPVSIAYHIFGGWKRSSFGDLNQHGPDSIRFYTKTKTVAAHWPSGTREGASFVIPSMA